MNAQLRSMDGEEDHVHLLTDYPPNDPDVRDGERAQGRL